MLDQGQISLQPKQEHAGTEGTEEEEDTPPCSDLSSRERHQCFKPEITSKSDLMQISHLVF